MSQYQSKIAQKNYKLVLTQVAVKTSYRWQLIDMHRYYLPIVTVLLGSP